MRPRSTSPCLGRACFLAAVVLAATAGLAHADHTPSPTTVTLPGDFQSELGCPGDWMPDCVNTDLTYDSGLDRWTGTFQIPAGNWQYKVAINHSWDENYGAGGVQNGPNIALILSQTSDVSFSYNPHTHVVTQSAGIIVVAPGSFQSELGCSGDWQPDCLLSQLTGPDGSGNYVFETTAIPEGSYAFKIAIGLTWDENYGQDGVPGGADIPFTVPPGDWKVTITYDPDTHVPTVSVDAATPVRRARWGELKVLYR